MQVSGLGDSGVANNPDTLTESIMSAIRSSSFSMQDLDSFSFEDFEPEIDINCRFYAEEHLSTLRDRLSKSFSVLTLNAQSLHAKIDEIRQLLYRMSQVHVYFNVVCIQETWLGDQDDPSLLALNGYDMICKPKHASAHGGLITYVHETLRHEIIYSTARNETWEGLIVKVSQYDSNDVIVGNVYRPPRMLNDDIIKFLNSFESSIKGLDYGDTPCVIAGDFNINLLEVKQKPLFTEYLELMLSESLYPAIRLPTRITDTSATLIDHIHVKANGIDYNSDLGGVINSNISDHQPCFTAFPHGGTIRLKNKQKWATVTTRNADFLDKMKQGIRDANMMHLLSDENDVNANYDIFSSVILDLVERNSSTKTIKVNKYNTKRSPWITEGIMISLKFRDKLYSKCKRAQIGSSRHMTLKINLKTYNKILKKLIKTAKASHYSNKFMACKNDGKQTWKAINELLDKSKSTDCLPDYINYNGKKISSTLDILDGLNSHFSSVGARVSNSIGQTHTKHTDYLREIIDSRFEFRTVELSEVNNIIKNDLKDKKSSGHDKISSHIVKKLKDVLCAPLTYLINQSISTGLFPHSLKTAKVKALFKKGDIHDPGNYRPISLLPAFSKIFEKALLKQLVDYFDRNLLLYSSQYGFRKAHSTEHAILELMDKINLLMDKGKSPFSIFIDLSKAFDCLDHGILIDKIKHYGVTGKALELLTNYLSNRQQFTHFESIDSNKVAITTGVPQGSILGPFFFLLYMNDFSKCSQLFSAINYADDTVLSSTMSTFGSLPPEGDINIELEKVSDWLKANKLCVNAGKSKVMFFSSINRTRPLPNIRFGETILEQVEEFNYLGVIISRDLKWDKHVKSVSARVSKTIGILKRIKNTVPQHVLKLIYQSLIACRFEYGILAWGGALSKLVKVQKKAMRIIVKAKYNAHTEPIFKKLGILKMGDLYRLRILVFYHKFVNEKLPSYFLHNFIFHNEDYHNYTTRNRTNLTVPMLRHELHRSTLRSAIARTVNDTPPAIVEKTRTHSLNGFTYYVRLSMLYAYLVLCEIRDCYICNERERERVLFSTLQYI